MGRGFWTYSTPCDFITLHIEYRKCNNIISGARAGDDIASDPVGFEAHDHAHCIDTAVAAAEAVCADQRLRFTPVRRKALEILLQEHRALGAYEMLDRLRDAGFRSQPPVAYRALEFPVANGFAHKIERLNAFIACAHPGAHHSPAFLICRRCDSVAEAQATPARGALGAAARAAGFLIERTMVEAVGICPACTEKADP